MARRQAQRQQDKQTRREQEHAARLARAQRRRQLVAIGVVATLVLATVGAVIAAVGSGGDSPSPTTPPSASSSPSSQPDASEPAPVDEVSLPDPGATASPGACPPEDGSGQRITGWPEAPPLCIAGTDGGVPDPALDYRATLRTSAGDLTFLLNTEQAPWAVNDFVTLARAGYLDGAPIDTVLADGWFEFGGRFSGGGDPGAGYTRPSEAPEVGSLYSPLALGVVPADPQGSASTGGRFLVATGVNAADLPADGTLFGLLLDGTDAYPRILRAGTSSGVPGEVIVIDDVTIEAIESI